MTRRLWTRIARRLLSGAPTSPRRRRVFAEHERLDDRITPATFTATIDPTLNNTGAVAEVIGFFEQSNANKESDTIVLFPGGVYQFASPYVDAKGVTTVNALPDLVPNPNNSQHSVTIQGEGATFQRTGGANYRLMSVSFTKALGGSEISTIRDLTLDGGSIVNGDGGGILITGTPTTFEFNNVIFQNNRVTGTGGSAGDGGAAAFNSVAAGSVNFRDCQFLDNNASENGGAVSLTGSSTIVGSTFARNNASANGGGLFNASGNVQVRNSLFLENTATGGGGFSGAGGAIRIGGAAVDTITNTTFQGNFATGFGGAISFDKGARGVLHFNTFTENASDDPAGGGAIDLDGTAISMTFSHNVFWLNTNGGKGLPGNEASDLWGRNYITQGFNFVSIGESTGQLTWTPLASDQWGTQTAALDAKLGPLQRNGGPVLTRSPLATSPLIEAGDLVTTAGITTDSRGYPRLVGIRNDIGAVEIQVDTITGKSSPSIVVTGGDRQVTAVNSFFPQLLEVTILDPYGTPIQGRTVTFSGPGVRYPQGRTAVSDVNGKASILTFANGFVGIHSVDAVLLGDNLKARFREVNKPGEGDVTATAGDGQVTVVTTQYGNALEVQTLNHLGVAVPNQQVYFAVLSAPAGGTFTNGQVIIPVTTDATGKASVTLTANDKAGAVQVVAAAGRYGAAFFNLTNLADVPVGLSLVSGNGQNTPIFQNFGDPLQVSAVDKYGNFVGGVPINFAGTISNDVAGVTFPNGTSVTTDTTGVASLTVGANSKVGTHQVVATSPAVSGTIVFALTNTFGPAAQLVQISGSGQSTRVTEAFSNSLVVQVFDTGGNLMTDVGVNFAGPTGFNAAPQFTSGTVATTDSQGIARLNLSANTKSGSYAVTASIPGAAPTTFTLTNRPGAASLISVTQGDNQTTGINTVFPTVVKIFAIDVFGNPIDNAVPTFTPPAGASATFAITPSNGAGIANVIATANGIVGTYRVSIRLDNALALLTLSNTEAEQTVFEPLDGLAKNYVVGAGEGLPHRVWVYNADGEVISEFQPYDAGFIGGVRSIVARTPSGMQIVTGPGPGRFADVRFFDTSGQQVRNVVPFEASFAGGVYLAAADINRDGWDDVVISADQGGGPRVQVVSGRDGVILADFFGIDDPNFRGGARVTTGDMNGDSIPEIIVAAGFGGGPRVAVFDGATVKTNTVPRRLIADFFVFEVSLRNGVFITSGDVDGDGRADLVFGGGPGGGPRVLALSGAELLNGKFRTITDFFSGQPSDRGGVRVTLKDLDDDNLADLVVGDGEKSGTGVTIYPGSFLTNRDSSAGVTSFDQVPGQTIGVYVG